MATIQLKRVYGQPSRTDGLRVLVDRLWPRGVSKAAAQIDIWAKDVAPSQELRQWFDHDPAKFVEFSQRYTVELSGNDAAKELLALVPSHPTTTLVFGAKDAQHNQAVVLKKYLDQKTDTIASG